MREWKSDMSTTAKYCKNTTLFLYFIFLIINFVSYLADYNLDFRNSYATFFSIVLALINIILTRKKVLGKESRRMLCGFLLLFLISLIHTQFVEYASYIYLEIITYFLFVINLFFLTRIILRLNCYKEIIWITIFTVAIFVLVLFVIYVEPVGGITLLSNAFSGINRYRNTFGLYHANQTGNIANLLFILSFYCLHYSKNNRSKIFIYFLFVISMYMILASASRNAILSLGIFCIVYMCFFLYYRFNMSSRILIIVISVSILFCVVQSIDFNYLISMSLRGDNFIGNLPNLKSFSDWLIGLGMVGSGYFMLGFSFYKTTYIDNYFLYVLMTSGIIGILLVYIPIIRIFYNIVRKKNIFNEDKNFIISLMIMMFFSSMFETNLLYPQFVSSFIYWMMIIFFIEEKNKRLKEKINNNTSF